MKKIISIILAVALMLSLCMISSFAESNVTGVSRDQLTVDGVDKAKFGGNSDNTAVDLTDSVGKELKIWGWLGTTSPIQGFGYKINDGELVTGEFTVAAGQDVIDAAKAGGATEASRFAIMVPITEGSYTVDAYVIMESGTEKIWTIIVNKVDEGAKYDAKAIAGNVGDPGQAIWLNTEGEYAAVKFTTTDEVAGATLFFWASDGTNGPIGSFKAELYAFDTNVETSFAKAPVAKINHSWTGDNQPVFEWLLTEPLAKGTYILKITIIGESANGQPNPDTAYVVFPAADSAPDAEKFEYVSVAGKDNKFGGIKFNFAVYGPAGVAAADYYTTNPAEGQSEQPHTGEVTPPQTGDAAVAMIAVIAVLAMGAAVVFAKKRSF